MRFDPVRLQSDDFVFALDVANGLRAVSWANRLTGQTIRLGRGLELELDLDIAERRIWILGWRGIESGAGCRDEFFRPEYDDSKWAANLSPAQFWHTGNSRWYWTRTHVFVPGDCVGKQLSLVLGGVGIYDFRYMRVFLNGHAIGTRRVADRWHEPGQFDLTDQKQLRFGQDNVIALQLAQPIRRTAHLDKLDPADIRSLPYISFYPAQFEQYIAVGQPLRTPRFGVHDVSVRPGLVDIQLRTKRPNIAALARYEWHSVASVLHKTVRITNAGNEAFHLMNLRLGHYQTDANVSDGEQGFPVYVDNEAFVSLSHPSGWAIGQRGAIELRQYPGKKLAPGESFESMEAIY